MTREHDEEALELATIDRLGKLGWETASGLEENLPNSQLGRETLADAVLMVIVDDHELRRIAGGGDNGGAVVPGNEDAAFAAHGARDIGSAAHQGLVVQRFEQLAAAETARAAGGEYGGEYDRRPRCLRSRMHRSSRGCSHAL